MSDQRNRLLVGQIGLDLGFLTPQQLQESLELQAGQPSPRPLGEVLIGAGALSEAQWALIRDEQRRRLSESVPYSGAPKESVSFGRLLVREELAPQEIVDQALRAQQDMADRSARKRLGEILVESGHLSVSDVHRALWLQGKVLMACSYCKVRFNILVVTAEHFPCKHCGMTLKPETEAVRADESAYLMPVVRAVPQTTRLYTRLGTAAPASAPAPATRMVSTRVVKKKRSFLLTAVMTLLGMVFGGVVVYLAMEERMPAPPEAVAQDPVPPAPALPEAPAPAPSAVPPPRATRRLVVEIRCAARYYQGQLGIVSAEGGAEAQQAVRDSGPRELVFDTLSSGAKHVVFLPREGAMHAVFPVRLPEYGELRLPVELKAGSKLRGSVLDEQRRPVAGARVTYTVADFLPGLSGPGLLFMGGGGAGFGPAASSSLSRAGVLSMSAVTDRSGGFTLEGLPPAPLTLRVTSGKTSVEAPGLVPGEAVVIRLPAGRP